MLTAYALGQGTSAPNSVGGDDRLYQGGGEPSITNFTISVERMCR